MSRSESRRDWRRAERNRDMPPLPRSCATCGNTYAPLDDATVPSWHGRLPSRDHILPLTWGGRNILPGGIRNLRWMCQECNRARGQCGHCVGALACARSIAEDTRQPLDLTIALLGMRDVDAARPRVSYMWTELAGIPVEDQEARRQSLRVWLRQDGSVISRGSAG